MFKSWIWWPLENQAVGNTPLRMDYHSGSLVIVSASITIPFYGATIQGDSSHQQSVWIGKKWDNETRFLGHRAAETGLLNLLNFMEHLGDRKLASNIVDMAWADRVGLLSSCKICHPGRSTTGDRMMSHIECHGYRPPFPGAWRASVFSQRNRNTSLIQGTQAIRPMCSFQSRT